MRRMIVLGLLVVAGAVTISAMQAPEQKPNVAEIEKVRDNLFMIKGGGGNTAAYVTSQGVILVDTKLANWGGAIMDKVRSVTDKPVTMIVNTHTHGDHTGSNEYLPRFGRGHRPREHQGEHGQDEGVSGRESEVLAGSYLHARR